MLFTLHASHQSTNYPKTQKSVLTQICIKQPIHKHQTQIFKELVPSVSPLLKKHIRLGHTGQTPEADMQLHEWLGTGQVFTHLHVQESSCTCKILPSSQWALYDIEQSTANKTVCPTLCFRSTKHTVFSYENLCMCVCTCMSCVCVCVGVYMCVFVNICVCVCVCACRCVWRERDGKHFINLKAITSTQWSEL